MSEQEIEDFRAKLRRGFDAVRYKLICEKALHDLYGEEVVTIVPVKKENN